MIHYPSKYLPNFLSLSRLSLLAPGMALSAWPGGSRAVFLSLLGAALLTDALDGFLARRLNVQSELGRRLDSWGDYATTAAGIFGIALLWSDEMRREWPWFLAAIIAYFAIVFYGLLRWGQVPGYHTRLSKAMAFALPLGLIPLLAGISVVPFHLAVALQVTCGAEEVAIALLLPGHSGEITGLRQALRLRAGPR